MKRALPIFILLCFSLSFCKKETTTAVKPGKDTTKTNDTIVTKTTFAPHVDTFVGLFTNDVDGTNDTSRLDTFYAKYDVVNYVIIFGSAIEVHYYVGIGAISYYPDLKQVTYNFATDTASVYNFNPSDDVYQTFRFIGDSLYIATSNKLGSCVDIETRSFAGKKR